MHKTKHCISAQNSNTGFRTVSKAQKSVSIFRNGQTTSDM